VDLSKYASEYVRRGERGIDLIKSGPASARLLERIGNEGKVRSLLATNFWRAWLASDLAVSVLKALDAPPGVLSRGRTIIVSQDEGMSFDLVVLDPELPKHFGPKSLSANVRGAMVETLLRGAVRSLIENPIPAIGNEAPQLAVEVSRNGEQPFHVVLGPEPAVERLSVPATPLSVDNGLGATRSTAGVLVEDKSQAGRIGVTAALHGVEPASSVTIAGQTGTVIRTDSITDGAFVELASRPTANVKSTNGVMTGMAPRGNQKAEFTGLASATASTVITSWDADVPNPSARRQACLYTPRDAQPGDSGSALITDDDWIVGFAFERTKPGANPEHCSWIWAESVLNRLNVKLA
jgi:hypothetical protein